MVLRLDNSSGSVYVVPMAMHKQMISLTQPQIEFLRLEAARLEISVSDLIRRIIDQHRENRS